MFCVIFLLELMFQINNDKLLVQLVEVKTNINYKVQKIRDEKYEK